MIDITPDQLRQTAQTLSTCANQVKDALLTLDGQASAILGDWQGLSQQKFMEQYHTSKNRALGYHEALAWAASALSAIADRFSEADAIQLDFGVSANADADGHVQMLGHVRATDGAENTSAFLSSSAASDNTGNWTVVSQSMSATETGHNP